jgi:type II secretory pathway predicted ATPase ExeA
VVQAIEIERACSAGGLVFVAGTREFCKNLEARILNDSRYAVCRSLSIEKAKVKLQDLMTAVCYDLSANWKEVKIPRNLEVLQEQFWQAVNGAGKQVILLVDYVDELPKQTLREVRRLFDVADSGRLTIVLFSRSRVRIYGVKCRMIDPVLTQKRYRQVLN